MRVVALSVALLGCGFEAKNPGGGSGPDAANPDGMGGGGGGGSMMRDIPHVPTVYEMAGTADITLASGTMIDTTSLTIAPAVNGAQIDQAPQEPSGPPLMVVRARSVTIPAGATVTVTGSRPLVIVADTIVIAGTLDGGGKRAVPGPGGATLAVPAPEGMGGGGAHRGSYADSGGGGGGHASVAGGGGRGSINCNTEAPRGTAGAMWGTTTIEILRGGAAGGPGSAVACTPGAPGAGGGAIQLSALTSVVLEASGAINVGGGGGTGGANCGGSDAGAGSGGGAGGALYLDAPMIRRDGALGANGGAGGGGASSPGSSGSPGGDATASTSAAQGGNGGGTYGARGGNGGTGTTEAATGTDDDCDGNAGGGGGAIGRIVIRATTVMGSGVASPAPTAVTLVP